MWKKLIASIKKEWFSNVKGDLLSGIVVALALIPEAIAFSIIAGVNPMMGLYACFSMAVVIAFAGGRPGMISAATGAMAFVLAPLVREHGIQYLLAATILTGIIQIIFGYLKIARFMRFVPRAVMIGVVNSLSILIFIAQMPNFLGISNLTYLFVGITLIMVFIIPRYVQSIPAPLIVIVILTTFTIYSDIDLRTVGDLGSITQALPAFIIPNIPFNVETLMIILPYSFALALVGLLESFFTASLLDEMTKTESDKNKEARGQGIANIINGFFGGMAGCAIMGQSVINVNSGGRSRLSTLTAGLFLMFLILILGDLVTKIPMPVLVGIMIMIAIRTFDWSSFSYIRKAPKTDALVMLTTVTLVVTTHNLSIGVIAGVILSAILFVTKISNVKVTQEKQQNSVVYNIKGPLFFASTEDFVKAFNTDIKNSHIVINFSDSHIWDDSAVGALDKIILQYREHHNTVTILGLDSPSQKMVDTSSSL